MSVTVKCTRPICSTPASFWAKDNIILKTRWILTIVYGKWKKIGQGTTGEGWGWLIIGWGGQISVISIDLSGAGVQRPRLVSLIRYRSTTLSFTNLLLHLMFRKLLSDLWGFVREWFVLHWRSTDKIANQQSNASSDKVADQQSNGFLGKTHQLSNLENRRSIVLSDKHANCGATFSRCSIRCWNCRGIVLCRNWPDSYSVLRENSILLARRGPRKGRLSPEQMSGAE